MRGARGGCLGLASAPRPVARSVATVDVLEFAVCAAAVLEADADGASPEHHSVAVAPDFGRLKRARSHVHARLGTAQFAPHTLSLYFLLNTAWLERRER